MRFFVLLLIAVPSIASLGNPVALTVTDRSGYARANEGVTTGVPIPQSANVTDVRNLMVTTAPGGACGGGTAVDSEITAVERWGGAPTNTALPLKWVWVETVLPSVPANGTAQVCLADRVGADPGTLNVTATASGGFITVDTGAMTFKVSTTAFNFLDTVTVGAATVVSSSASNTWKVVANGVTYNTSNPDSTYVAAVEHTVTGDANSAGEQIRAQVKLSGSFTAPGGAQIFNYMLRISAYAGGTTLTVRPVIVFSNDMFNAANKPTEITLSLPMEMSGALSYTFGGANSTTVTGTADGSTDDVYLLQYDHGHGTPGGLPGYVVARNGSSVAAGTQAPGWYDVNNGTVGATVWFRDLWQRFPAEFELSGQTLNVGMWPAHGDVGIPGIGDGAGILTQVFDEKRDAALTGTPVNGSLLPYSVMWPYAGGAAMDLTPVAPNLSRAIYTVSQGATSVVSANLNVMDTGEGYCTTQPLPSCHYWPSGTTQRVHVSGFTGCWAALNGFHVATWNGTYSLSSFPLISLDADTSACPLPVTPPLNQQTSNDPVISNMDTMTDMQPLGVAEEWEVQYRFYAGTPPIAAAAAAQEADRLMLLNPAWLASTDAAGHIKEVDTADFPLAETNMANAIATIFTAMDTLNYYGSLHYGDYVYDNTGPTGEGGRTFAAARKDWSSGPWMQYIRTGDRSLLDQAIAVTTHGINVDYQHTTASGTDANNNIYDKHVGAGICTHGPTHYYPTNVTTNLGSRPYPCSEGQEPALDYSSGAAEMFYVMAAHDRSKEWVVNELYPWVWLASGGTSGIQGYISGRAFGGCLELSNAMYHLSGAGLALGEACFAGVINHGDGTASLGNPVGESTFDKYGNAIGQGFMGFSWAQLSFPEFDALDPNYSALDPNGVSHTVDAEFIRTAKAHMGMGVTGNTTAHNFYNFQGKLWNQAYLRTSDPTFLQYGQRMMTQYSFPGVTSGVPGPEGWASYVLDLPYAERALAGVSPGAPDNPPYESTAPANGTTQNYIAHKAADQSWTFTLSIDTSDNTDGDYFILAGNVTVDVIAPNGTKVIHQVRQGCRYQGPTPCIPSRWTGSAGTYSSNNSKAGESQSLIYGGVDNRVWTVTVPADGQTGDYTVQISSLTGANNYHLGTPKPSSPWFTQSYILDDAAVAGYCDGPGGGSERSYCTYQPFTIAGYTPGNPTILEIDGHGFAPGDTPSLNFIYTAGSGWSAINGATETGTVVDSNHISIPVNSTGWGALTSYSLGAFHGVPLNAYTVATLPASPADGTPALVTDAVADCQHAGGGNTHLCKYNAGTGAWDDYGPALTSGLSCTGDPPDSYRCYSNTHFLYTYGSSLGNWTLVAPSVTPYNFVCPPNTPRIGRGLYYFKVPAGSSRLRASMTRSNAFLLSPSGLIYNTGATSSGPSEPGMWALVTDPNLDDGGTYCTSLYGVKPLLAASPQVYYDAPSQSVSSTYYDWGGGITVNFTGATCSITTTTLPGGTVGTPYSQTPSTANCIPPATWSIPVGSLPAWASLNPSTGNISGTPTMAATTSFTMHVADSGSNTYDQPLSIAIAPAPTCTITTTTLPGGRVGAPYSQTPGTANCTAPDAWSISAGSLPGWASLNASTGNISGTPTAAATTGFTMHVADSRSNAYDQPLSITIALPREIPRLPGRSAPDASSMPADLSVPGAAKVPAATSADAPAAPPEDPPVATVPILSAVGIGLLALLLALAGFLAMKTRRADTS